jgi:hypothetical protein
MRTLTHAQYKRHDAITFMLFIAMMLLIAVVALTHTSCSTIRTYDDMSAAQKSWFDACIEQHPSDAVCDSCFNAIVSKR